MNRRGFLQALASAGLAISPVGLLLPRKTFFLPPVGGWPVSTYTHIAYALGYKIISEEVVENLYFDWSADLEADLMLHGTAMRKLSLANKLSDFSDFKIERIYPTTIYKEDYERNNAGAGSSPHQPESLPGAQQASPLRLLGRDIEEPDSSLRAILRAV